MRRSAGLAWCWGADRWLIKTWRAAGSLLLPPKQSQATAPSGWSRRKRSLRNRRSSNFVSGCFLNWVSRQSIANEKPADFNRQSLRSFMHIGLIGGIGVAATEFYYRGLIDRHERSG